MSSRKKGFTEARKAALKKANDIKNEKAERAFPTPKKTIGALTSGFRDLRERVGIEKDITREQSKELTRLQHTSLKASALLEELNSKIIELEEQQEELLSQQKELEDTSSGIDVLSTRAAKYRRAHKAQALVISRLKLSKKQKEQEIEKKREDIEKMKMKLTRMAEEDEEVAESFKDQIYKLQALVEDLEAELLDANMELEERYQEICSVHSTYGARIRKLDKRVGDLEAMVERLRIEEEDLIFEVDELASQLSESEKASEKLKASLRRAQSIRNNLEDYQRIVEETLQFKKNGAYNARVRSLVRQMVVLGCPLKNIGAIIDCFYQQFSKPLLRSSVRKEKVSIDSRSARRFIEEGKIASELQMVIEMIRSPGQFLEVIEGPNTHETKAFTTSSDGTTHRSLNYESAHINVHAPSSYAPGDDAKLEPKIRRAEVRLASDHKTTTQIAGDLAYLDLIIDQFNRSPLAAEENAAGHPINNRSMFKKWAGTHGDHAEDQKAKNRRLGEMKKEQTDLAIGEEEFHSLLEEQRLDIRKSVERVAIDTAGGPEPWGKLDPLEQQKLFENVFEDMLKTLAVNAKLKMTEDELKLYSHWVYAGCQMHKDLNAVKGACNAMKEAWKTKNVAPCPLANRDNAAILEAAARGGTDSRVLEHATAATVGGAIKLAELAGALFNHKDDKKGFHDQFSDFAKLNGRHTTTFPDTSNTRFGSYLEAAAELMSDPDFFLKFIEHLRNLKEKRNLNHLEENVKQGLLDEATLTELAVLTLYQEGISHPYITTVRGHGLETTNALEMGSYHQEVVNHIHRLLRDPDLILSPTAEPQRAKLGAYTHWKRPDAMRAVHAHAHRLPYLREMFVAFLEGALKTWERFSAEFAPDGIIEQLTVTEKKMIWMPTTNDANEGALGEWRSFSRRYPSGSLGLFNAISTYRHNNTQDFIDNLLSSDEEQSYLREEAKKRLEEKVDSKKRKAVAEEMAAESERKRLKGESNAARKKIRAEHLDSLQLETNPAVLAGMTVADLKDQLAKYRAIDKEAKEATYLRKKGDLLRVVSEAAARYLIKDCSRELELFR